MDDSPRWPEAQNMLRAPDRRELPRIRELIRAEIAANEADEDLGCGDTLYALCFLLFLVGDAEDVALVHQAKFLNMDTGSMIDSFLLTMQRDSDTMMKVAAALSLERPRLAGDLAKAFAEPVGPDALEGLRSYFRL